jgi:hypothetical protein
MNNHGSQQQELVKLVPLFLAVLPPVMMTLFQTNP